MSSLLFSPHALEGRFVARLDVHESPGASIALDVVASWGLGLATLFDGSDTVSVAGGWVFGHSELQRVLIQIWYRIIMMMTIPRLGDVMA